MKAGKLSELILNRSVLKKIRNKRKEVLCGAKTGNDAVILRTDGDLTAACAASSSFFYIPEDFTDSEACLASVLLNAELVVLRAANSVSASHLTISPRDKFTVLELMADKEDANVETTSSENFSRLGLLRKLTVSVIILLRSCSCYLDSFFYIF